MVEDKVTPLEFMRKSLSHGEWNKIDPESKIFRNLGVDSLEFLELVILVEDYYNIQFEDDEFTADLTVGRFCEMIEEKLA